MFHFRKYKEFFLVFFGLGQGSGPGSPKIYYSCLFAELIETDEFLESRFLSLLTAFLKTILTIYMWFSSLGRDCRNCRKYIDQLVKIPDRATPCMLSSRD